MGKKRKVDPGARVQAQPRLVATDIDGPWRVKISPRRDPGETPRAHCDRHSRELLVPAGLKGTERTVRFHEMGHARWSTMGPADMSRVFAATVPSCQCAEDNRINRALGLLYRLNLDRADVNAELKIMREAVAAAPHDADMAVRAVMHATARQGLAHAEKLAELARLALNGWSAELGRSSIEFGMLRAARMELERAGAFGEAGSNGLSTDPVSGSDRNGVKVGPAQLTAAGRLARALDQLRAVANRCMGEEETGEGEEEAQHATDQQQTAGLGVTWARLGLPAPLDPKLCERLALGRTHVDRPSYAGARIRRIERIWSDGKPFSRRHRNSAGGTLVLDVTGSMHITPEHVRTIVEASPCTAVFAYDGIELQQLAGRGLVLRNMGEFDGANRADLPMLEWLAKQPGPRVYVSDGLFCGQDNKCTQLSVAPCLAAIGRGRIRLVGWSGPDATVAELARR